MSFPNQVLMPGDSKYYDRGQDPRELEQQAHEQVLTKGLTIAGLTPYELNRDPLPLLSATSRAISTSLLNQEITCPICLSIVDDTYCTMECLHRFCQECIQTSLRTSKKECPTCREKCSSKRNLRADTKFDEMIHALYPDKAARERQISLQTAQLNKSYDFSQHIKNYEEGIKRQKAAFARDHKEKKKKRKIKTEAVSSESSRRGRPRKYAAREVATPVRQGGDLHRRDSDTHASVNVVLRRKPSETQLKELNLEEMNAPKISPIGVLASLVFRCADQRSTENPPKSSEQIELTIQSAHFAHDVVVPHSHSIGSVLQTHWGFDQPQMTVFYSLVK